MQRLPQNQIVSPRTGLLIGMIAFAVGVRLLIYFVPGALPYNFTPVEAIALFGGAYFTDRRVAFILPLAAMFLADLVIGLHMLLPLIYACVAATVAMGFVLRNRVSVVRVARLGIASALLFFVVVSFVEWLIGDTSYCQAGLGSCYLAAVPFLKNQVVGTLIWSVILFGGFELVRRRWSGFDSVRA